MNDNTPKDQAAEDQDAAEKSIEAGVADESAAYAEAVETAKDGNQKPA